MEGLLVLTSFNFFKKTKLFYSVEARFWADRIMLLFFKIYLIEGYLLYSIVLVSTKHQHESAIGSPMSPPT